MITETYHVFPSLSSSFFRAKYQSGHLPVCDQCFRPAFFSSAKVAPGGGSEITGIFINILNLRRFSLSCGIRRRLDFLFRESVMVDHPRAVRGTCGR